MNRRTKIVVLMLGIGVPIGVTVTQYFENRPEPKVVVTFDYSLPPWRFEQPGSISAPADGSGMLTEPAGFLTYLQTLQPPAPAKIYAGPWMSSYKGQRFNHSEELPEAVRSQVLFDGEIRDWLPGDPEQAMRELKQFLIEDSISTHAITCLAIWASRDPIAASLWHRDHAASFPHPGMDGAAGEIAAQWCRQNPAAAARWVRKLFGAAREDAAYAMVTELVWSDPADAATWTVDVVEPKRHAAAVAQVALFWLHADPAAAEAWIRSDALSAEERQMVTLHFGLAP